MHQLHPHPAQGQLLTQVVRALIERIALGNISREIGLDRHALNCFGRTFYSIAEVRRVVVTRKTPQDLIRSSRRVYLPVVMKSHQVANFETMHRQWLPQANHPRERTPSSETVFHNALGTMEERSRYRLMKKQDANLQIIRKDHPDDWVSGDGSMTGAQSFYLRTLSERAHQPDMFSESLSKAEASKRIDSLNQQLQKAS